LRSEFVVADVGAGTGFMAAGLAPHVAKVYVLDGSEAMLSQARRNLAAYDNVVFEVSGGSTLPLPDRSVDAAFANMYLHHCPDPVDAG
jgi:ubiquinone/menaquinone biosynthesis C-methylase UbiE